MSEALDALRHKCPSPIDTNMEVNASTCKKVECPLLPADLKPSDENTKQETVSNSVKEN